MDADLLTVIVSLATLLVLFWALVKIVALGKLVAQLAEKIPGTAMTAKELADELGPSIDQAFANYVPKPESLEKVISGAVGDAAKGNIEQVQTISKTLTEAASAFASGSETSAKQLSAALAGYAEEIQNSLVGVGARWKDDLSGMLEEHTQQVKEANQALSADLQKIAALQQEIEKVLHVQQTVEGLVSQVATSEAFTQTLDGLRKHLEESDHLLREAAKPRTIRLVESDDELSEDGDQVPTVAKVKQQQAEEG